MPTKLKSGLGVGPKCGIFGVHQQAVMANLSHDPATLLLSFIPRTSWHTIGITASFDSYSNRMSSLEINRSIETSTVLLRDSAIIQGVSHNDLKSVQRLLE